MLHLPCQFFGSLQSEPNDLKIFLWCFDSALALLLKAVQHKYGFLKSDGVNGAIRTTRIVLSNLKHPGASKSSQHLGCIVPFAYLSKIQCVSEESPHRNWKRQ